MREFTVEINGRKTTVAQNEYFNATDLKHLGAWVFEIKPEPIKFVTKAKYNKSCEDVMDFIRKNPDKEFSVTLEEIAK